MDASRETTGNPAPVPPGDAAREMELAVFRAGAYGERGSYSRDDLDRLVASYDPARHEAPLTIDHEERGPAHGWVRGLRREGDVLVARVGALSGFIRRALATGGYRKPSVELFLRDPATGEPTLGLRAVSLLGSMVPRVGGLPAPCVGGVEGDDAAVVLVASGGALDAAAVATFERGDAATRAAATIAALRREGHYLPAWDRLGVPAFLAWLEGEGSGEVVAFGGGAGAAPATWFARFLASLGALRLEAVGEPARGEAAAGAEERLRLPAGCAGARVAASSVALHERAARRLRAEPGLGYAAALRAVAGEGAEG